MFSTCFDVFLAVPTVVGDDILEVCLAVPTVVGENILEFFLFWELQGTDAALRARMQRRGHTGRAHYKPANTNVHRDGVI